MGETNGLSDGFAGWRDEFPKELHEPVAWDDERIERFVRIRLLSDPGYPVWDVSYAYALIAGQLARLVNLPGDGGTGQLNKKHWKANAIRDAREAGVYLKGLGFFDAVSTLV